MKPVKKLEGTLTAEQHEIDLTQLALDLESAARRSLAQASGVMSVATANAFRTAFSARKAASILADARVQRSHELDCMARFERMNGHVPRPIRRLRMRDS